MTASAADRRSAFAADVVERWEAMRWPLVPGAVCVVVGGLVAAATRPLGFSAGSWVAALLVLVGGVAQIGLGIGRVHVPATPPSQRRVRGEVVLWNAAIVLTISGSLLGQPILSTAASALLGFDLYLLWRATRRGQRGRARLGWVLDAVLCILAISVPVGLFLAWVRHA